MAYATCSAGRQDLCLHVLISKVPPLVHLNIICIETSRQRGLRQSILRHAFTGQLVPQTRTADPRANC